MHPALPFRSVGHGRRRHKADQRRQNKTLSVPPPTIRVRVTITILFIIINALAPNKTERIQYIMSSSSLSHRRRLVVNVVYSFIFIFMPPVCLRVFARSMAIAIPDRGGVRKWPDWSLQSRPSEISFSWKTAPFSSSRHTSRTRPPWTLPATSCLMKTVLAGESVERPTVMNDWILCYRSIFSLLLTQPTNQLANPPQSIYPHYTAHCSAKFQPLPRLKDI